MPCLRDLQASFAGAILEGWDEAVIGTVVVDGISSSGRLSIYRHHVFTTLSGVLREAYPVVCRLVHERFFGYAADRFIRSHPPQDPRLFEYGSAFPQFLAEFPPCHHLAYLPDVARLEWQIHAALHAEDPRPLNPMQLDGVPSTEVGELTFSFVPSLALLTSPWPIGAIWHANQPHANDEHIVDLASGPVNLEIRRIGDDVVFRTLDPVTHAFRRALVEGRSLEQAASAAAVEGPRFDLARALYALFQDGVFIAFMGPSTSNERTP